MQSTPVLHASMSERQELLQHAEKEAQHLNSTSAHNDQGTNTKGSHTGTARLAHLGPMRSPVSAQVQADVVKEDCCQTGLISYRYYTPGTPRPHAFPGVCNKCKRM
eukprot:1144123-Pelagomonas_calceolata.AAC.6